MYIGIILKTIITKIIVLSILSVLKVSLITDIRFIVIRINAIIHNNLVETGIILYPLS